MGVGASSSRGTSACLVHRVLTAVKVMKWLTCAHAWGWRMQSMLQERKRLPSLRKFPTVYFCLGVVLGSLPSCTALRKLGDRVSQCLSLGAAKYALPTMLQISFAGS